MSGPSFSGRPERRSQSVTHFDFARPTASQPYSGRLVSADACEQHYRVWPAAEARAAIVYVHGIEGHSAWIEPTAAPLNRAGFSLYAFDRRGAGASGGPRGHLQSASIIVDDIVSAVTSLRAKHGRLFLMANCWGAKAAVVAACLAGSRLSGLILTSPALAVKVDLPLPVKLAIGWAWLTRSPARFDLPLTAEMFTDNPGYLRFIEEDPLRLTAATASFFVESMKLESLAWAKAPALGTPLLVLQAGRDSIVDAEGVRRWFARAGSADKSLRVFAESAHSLDFDEHPEPYRQTLIGWLDEHLEAGAA